jgi:hypothetical protein
VLIPEEHMEYIGGSIVNVKAGDSLSISLYIATIKQLYNIFLSSTMMLGTQRNLKRSWPHFAKASVKQWWNSTKTMMKMILKMIVLLYKGRAKREMSVELYCALYLWLIAWGNTESVFCQAFWF